MRLFVAAFLPGEARDALRSYAQSLSGEVAGVRWEPPEKFHVTLRFLGEVAEADVGSLSRDVGERVSGSGGVESGFSGLRVFPGRKSPRVLAVSLSRGPRFSRLFEAVEAAVLKNGFGGTKGKFVPHVTIGRVRGSFGGARGVSGPGGERFVIRSVGLVGSELRPGGSRYSLLETWDLAGGI